MSYEETLAKVRALSERYPDPVRVKPEQLAWRMMTAGLGEQFDEWRRKYCGCWACEMRPVWRALRASYPHQTEEWR